LLFAGLKYAGYPRRLRKMIALLTRQMVERGLPAAEAQTLAQRILRGLVADLEKARQALQTTTLGAEDRAFVLRTVQDQALPLLKKPITDLEKPTSANPRFRSEWNRSFVLGLFTFVWFFVVPMPELLVFTAPYGYRVSISPASALHFAVAVVGVAVIGGAVSLLLDWWERNGSTGKGLAELIQYRYQSFQSLTGQAGRLTPLQSSCLYAMFTDVQTFFDQRSYAYARSTLKQIEQTLNTAEQTK